jgi:hypothetical protein
MKNKWSDRDKQDFKDGNVLKAKSIPAKKDPGPSAEEWREERIVLERTDVAQQDFYRRMI